MSFIILTLWNSRRDMCIVKAITQLGHQPTVYAQLPASCTAWISRCVFGITCISLHLPCDCALRWRQTGRQRALELYWTKSRKAAGPLSNIAPPLHIPQAARQRGAVVWVSAFIHTHTYTQLSPCTEQREERGEATAGAPGQKSSPHHWFGFMHCLFIL